jgi:hypothetical protein
MPLVSTIISGGQSGADRAGLDAAIALGLDYGGWCPKGGRAEDYSTAPGLLADYPMLWEHSDPSYPPRTEANVNAADATLLIARLRGGRRLSVVSPGTRLTIELARKSGKPLFIVDPRHPGAVETLHNQLDLLGGDITLNVAGPRESRWPTIYRGAARLIYAALR